MNTGQIISGAGHVALIGWILFGASFQSADLPFDAVQVTTVSSEEYAAIVSGAAAPEQADEITPPAAPAVPQEAPDLSSQADAAPELPQPDPAPEAAPDPAPQPPAPPAPDADVSDAAPVLEPPADETAALLPDTSPRPQQRPAERIAPQQVEPPAPDTRVDDVVREEAVPDESADTPAPETEATAPEAAATEIVTEAEQPEQPAPSSALRPKSRPARLAPPTETAEAEAAPDPAPEAPSQPATESAATDSAGIDDALAAALGAASDTPAPAAPSAPAGPPLTAGEKDGLRIAVQNCWNVGSLSSDALTTTVTVAFEMSQDARPIEGSITMKDSSGGTSTSARQAYEAARRAIIRCGARGFGLPVEKYASWRNVEMTFNPENMRIK